MEDILLPQVGRRTCLYTPGLQGGQMVMAVHAMHKEGVIHCDLKTYQHVMSANSDLYYSYTCK